MSSTRSGFSKSKNNMAGFNPKRGLPSSNPLEEALKRKVGGFMGGLKEKLTNLTPGRTTTYIREGYKEPTKPKPKVWGAHSRLGSFKRK